MFNSDQFVTDAQLGRPVDVEALRQFVRGFERVYIWGAGNLGREVARVFHANGVEFDAFWDTRAGGLGILDGKQVIAPFVSLVPQERTLVVFCITSSFSKDHCLAQLAENGFTNRLQGSSLYEAFICQFHRDRNFLECRNADACDVFTCEKNEYFHKKTLNVVEGGADPSLYFKNVTFVINQTCSLKCKFCYSYSNAYDKTLRSNFDTAQICSDIDVLFDSIEGVKIVPLIGGETFLHPDVNRIVKKFLTKSNFGLLNVTTNGVVKIHDEQIEMLGDPRIQVVFSNYKSSLPARANEVFDANVEKIRSVGAKVIVLNETPQWNVPTTLWDKGYSLETMKIKRDYCRNPLICKYVKNGKFFPCTVADSIYNLDVADYEGDYIALDPAAGRPRIRENMHRLIGRDYYHSCGHCDGICGYTGVTAKAGEQGFFEILKRVDG